MSEEGKACFDDMKVPSFGVTIVFKCVRWSGGGFFLTIAHIALIRFIPRIVLTVSRVLPGQLLRNARSEDAAT
ncbi:hypothetical protein F0562_006748 [Nyssa sinensis]|uniref:Uncharacterized protein n=1 Tax=Nyssa sinensis TaxID=561372 RepID=A0A5J5AN83_9ASTE|nr:hypothetical protein F0562_006748 [Nyssa sinensis]